ncbi:DNA polymerase IV [Marinobacterium jannaschii]|uniref:DNA polymerase IV n=1 Tax=Marinobacterium jannaschii TaxID=64970 RepID=UPI000483F29F|nr:DNA polymerase IV [Marinobacterium jannaschii]
MQRKIIHCDCDCFYAAVEMRDNPALASVPLAIGGSSERRGVIATCNYAAREYGVRSAMATAHALKLCPDLKVISGNMETYRQVSKQIMAIYADYTDLIEPLSLDEAYLDVSASTLHQGSATLIAEEIRQRVRQEVGITVSAGVAPVKFLAKVASDWNKPDGLFVIRPREVADFVETLPVKRLFGVGEKTAAKLQRLGVESCGDLHRFTLAQLVEHFGRFGQRLYELCRGQDERPVRVSRERKSISVEHTFSRDLPGLEPCLEQLPGMLQELEQRYQRHRDQRSVIGAVVKIKFADFSQTTVEQCHDAPLPPLFAALMQQGFARGNKPVRLLGVGYRLGEKRQQQGVQLSLL